MNVYQLDYGLITCIVIAESVRDAIDRAYLHGYTGGVTAVKTLYSDVIVDHLSPTGN